MTEIDRNAAKVLNWLESRGYVERTGVWARPRRLTAAGLRVCASFAAHFERLMREERERAKPKRGKGARAPRARSRNTPLSSEVDKQKA